jgi:hypothetical protein
MVYNSQNCLGEILNLQEVGLKVHLSCSKAIKEWLKENGVNLYNLGTKKNMVYLIDLEVALLFPKAKRMFLTEEDWEFQLHIYCGYNDRLVELIKQKLKKIFPYC